MLRDHVFGLRDGPVRVAARNMAYGLHVRFFLLEDERCILCPRLGRVMDGGQRFIVDLYKLLRFFQRLRSWATTRQIASPR